MIVFRESHELKNSHEYLKEIESSVSFLLKNDSDKDKITELLIETGVFESGIADSINEYEDNKNELLKMLRLASVEAAEIYLSFIKDEHIRIKNSLSKLIIIFNDIGKCKLPVLIKTKIPEGYSYYSLYPEMYIEAAKCFLKDYKPSSVLVIGIRNIGTSLSAVVIAALRESGCNAESITVRPHGHPFNRELKLTNELKSYIISKRDSYFIIADEGPGLSGSSFSSAAAALKDLGIKEEQMILFPSWLPDGNQFVSKGSGDIWKRLKKYSVCFDEIKDSILNIPSGDIIEISGGKWRDIIIKNKEIEYPPVNPQFEKRKYLLTRDSKQYLIKFAGLGRYGREVLIRAIKLSEAGFAPQVYSYRNGFIIYEYLPHEPVSEFLDNDLLAAAGYLSFIKKNFPAKMSLSSGKLLEMIYWNIKEGLSPEHAEIFLTGNWDQYIEKDKASEIDNRVMKHEWIRHNGKLFKSDGDNHYKDHFFPGCIDIAWDLAGIEIEFNLDKGSFETLLGNYIQLSKDTGVKNKLHFYRIAYLSFNLGYSVFSADNLKNSYEELLFRKKADYYRTILIKLLN